MKNVRNKHLYHIHRSNIYDVNWQPNKIINVNEDFISFMYSSFMDFRTGIYTSRGVVDISALLNEILNPNILELIDKDKLVALLEESKSIISNASLINREIALENFRSKYYPNLPSRYHSIWLTDKNGLEYWQRNLTRKNSETFKVSIMGNLFKSNEALMPLSGLTYGEIYENAEKYWNPDLDSVPREKDEYLFQGTAKILKRIK